MKRLYSLILLALPVIAIAQHSTITLQPGPGNSKDASVGYHPSYGTENQNYATDVYLKAFSILDASNEPNKNRGLINFNLASITAGSVIISAKLSLYAAGAAAPTIQHTGANSSTLKRIVEPWDLNTVTWNTAPLTTDTNMVTMPASTNSLQDFIDIDVTALVKDMIAQPGRGHGFFFSLVNENTPPAVLGFYSSDASDPNKRPKLVITYSPTSIADEAINSFNADVFPNPSNGSFNVSYNLHSPGEVNVMIFNSTGQIAYSSRESSVPGSNNMRMDLDLNAGIYFLTISSGNISVRRKILID